MFTDIVSGKSAARPQLKALLAYVRDGDTVIVHSMDRLARNLKDLRRLVRELTGRGVAVQFVTEQLTFTAEDSPMAALLLSVLGAFAKFERALIRERQLEGIALAKARGAYTGRKPSLTPGPGRGAAGPCRGRGGQGGPGPRVRHQPPDPLLLPGPAGAGVVVDRPAREVRSDTPGNDPRQFFGGSRLGCSRCLAGRLVS